MYRPNLTCGDGDKAAHNSQPTAHHEFRGNGWSVSDIRNDRIFRRPVANGSLTKTDVNKLFSSVLA
jgi:hypothetical protein